MVVGWKMARLIEARFADNAWYDVELLAPDKSKTRFLCKTKELAGGEDDEEWVEASLIRYQSTPCTTLPKVGDTVLALHRKDRSDLFFDGEVVTKKPDNNKVVLSFSLGRAKGQKCTIDLEDLHQISRKKLGVEELLKLCKRRQPLQVDQSRVPLELHAGNFVVIDGPKNQTWVAQLMESFVGKISTEVEDVEEDGQLVKLRWLYRPEELPANALKKSERNKREVLLSNHMDKMDARLLVKKARLCFSLVPPASNVKWQDDELYCCRWWEPQQNKVFALDDPGLKSNLRRDIDELLEKHPLERKGQLGGQDARHSIDSRNNASAATTSNESSSRPAKRRSDSQSAATVGKRAMLSKDVSRGSSKSPMPAKTLHDPRETLDSWDTEVLAGVIDILEPDVGPLGERRSLRGSTAVTTSAKQENTNRAPVHRQEAKSPKASSSTPAGGVSKPSAGTQRGTKQTSSSHQQTGQEKGSRPKSASGAKERSQGGKTEAENVCDRSPKSVKKTSTAKKSLFADLDISLSRDHKSGGSGVFLKMKAKDSRGTKWNCSNLGSKSDEEAFDSFARDAAQHVVSNYVRDGECKAIVYFMLPKQAAKQGEQTQRELTSIGIQKGFENESYHRQCVSFLRDYSEARNAIAAIVVAETDGVIYPKLDTASGKESNAEGKHQKGLYFQVEYACGDDSRRELWVVYPDAAKKPFVELDLGISGAEKRGIMPPLLPRNRHLFGP